jgi:ABC-2 type transport system ATP-binding protein
MLFLDEPTVGMDVETRRAFWGRIRALADRGRTILLTTHYLEEADALADRIVVLNRGRIVADGTATAIKARVTARRIRCRSSLRLAEIQALDHVDLARGDREGFEIFTASPERVVRDLLTRDAELIDLEVTSAALEDAFLALTQGVA